MREFLRQPILCFAVLLSLCLVASVLLAQREQADGGVLFLKQEQFPARRQGESMLKKIDAKFIDGMAVTFENLPEPVREKLKRMETRLLPRVDFSSVDPKEAIRFLVRTPKPKHMIRLGLVSDHQERKPEPAWLHDLQLGDNKLSCTLTNVSVLAFSVLLAESFDCEFGVDPKGKPVFRNKGPQARAKHPACVIKHRPADSK